MEKIAILGAGGVGGTIGAYLLRDGRDVTLIDQWPAHVDAIKDKGLTLTDVKGTISVRAPALHINEVCNIFDPFDIVVMCVKGYDVRWMTWLIEPVLKATGYILVAQNGMNDLCVANVVGHHRTIGCVVTLAAGVYEPGHIQRTDPMTARNFTVGELSGVITPRVGALVSDLELVGASTATTNIWGARWTKLAVNCMGNAISGLLHSEERSMSPEQEDIVQSIRITLASETVRVGLAMGIPVEPVRGIPAEELAYIDSDQKMQRIKDEVIRQTQKRQPAPQPQRRNAAPRRESLLQDVIKGRRTEVDFLNGYVVTKGQEVGVGTPMNSAITDFMRRQEMGKGQSAEKILVSLEKYLAV